MKTGAFAVRVQVPLLSLAIWLASATSVQAQPRSDNPITDAKSLFQQGRDAFDHKDYQRAHTLFRQSQALHSTPGTLLNLGLAEEQLGMLLGAQQHLREALATLPPNDERQPLVQQHLAAVEARIPRLQIVIHGAAPGMRVTRDGELIAGDRLGAELPVEPVAHSIVVSVPGRPDRRYDVTVEEGKRYVVVVEPSQEPTPTRSGPTRDIAVQRSSGAAAGTRTIAALTAAGLGIAGLGIGTTTGILAMTVKKDVDEHCPGATHCSRAGVALENTGKTLGAVSTVSLIIGAAGVGAGAFLLLWKGGEGATATSAAVGPAYFAEGGGVGVSGRF